ncbi:MAG: site-specific DNA-methyltransferase [Ignavibacteriae bacterium]|nr:site-specific DNA-methyltransferase [Ignavibacteriota bacterium]
MQNYYRNRGIHLINDDVLNQYDKWENPVVIISDGPYGIGGYKGDFKTFEELPEFYEPHIKKWSEKSSPITTLWFWNTEVGWATIHPLLVKYGWKFVNCHVWNKGIGHIAGNVNGKSIRKFPIVTEVCVQYTKEPYFTIGETKMTMREWLKYEWSRTGLPFSKTNEVCGVKDAATRKYFTQSWLWYIPPVDAFYKIQRYANKYGDKNGRPFFSVDSKRPINKKEWLKYRSIFNYKHGITNVWHEPTVNGKERLRNGYKSLHLNQKPIKLMDIIISSSSNVGDIIWEPFGGLCSGILSAAGLNRKGYACEIEKEIYNFAVKRLTNYFNELKLFP